MSKLFNVRVYGVLMQNNAVLLLEEPFAGKLIHKFPGGGLEFGEGLLDCLKREFLEELNLKIKVNSHFYTQDFYLASRFNNNEQVIMIYYLVEALNLNELRIMDEGINQVIWKNLSILNTTDLPLQTDRVVAEKLLELK